MISTDLLFNFLELNNSKFVKSINTKFEMQISKGNFNFISQNVIPNSEFQIEYQNIKQEFNVNIHVRVAMASKKKKGSNS
jgi:hypothetical protein